MISAKEASDIILSHCWKPSIAHVPIGDAINQVLAEPIVADRNFPPFDRVTMDGIAISYTSFEKGQRTFRIESVQAAGEAQKSLMDSGNAIEVMTGAMLPEGTDTVIRYEDLTIENEWAQIQGESIEKGQNLHRMGLDAHQGDVLLEPGLLLSAAEIALLATVGKTVVRTFCFPKTVIISSGNELVDIEKEPLPYQTRRSNAYALQAAMLSMGWGASQIHLPDDKLVLEEKIGVALKVNDVVVLSGGVSKGKLDFIPGVLEALGVRRLFHQVLQRPGKPFWFGVTDSGKTVFALPGNPVSTFMCFYVYILPWIRKSMLLPCLPQKAILAKDFSFQPRLTYFLQVSVQNEGGLLKAYPESGGGSGDFANLKKVDGFLQLSAERTDFKAGEAFPFIAFRL